MKSEYDINIIEKIIDEIQYSLNSQNKFKNELVMQLEECNENIKFNKTKLKIINNYKDKMMDISESNSGSELKSLSGSDDELKLESES